MSYSGSQQQYGLNDLQLLQQHIMLAQLQELQKQQQLGQQSSVNNPSLFSKQASGGQIQNLNSGIPLNTSQMFAAGNMNWMQRTVSSPMQNNTSSSSYSHDQGIMMNPAMQQPDISFYGTPVASGRGNIGQYSPLRGVSHISYNMLSVNSEQKSLPQVSPFSNFFLHDKHSIPAAHAHSLDGSFMVRQGLQGSGSVEQGPVAMLNSGVSSRNIAQAMLEKDMSLVEHHRTPGQHGCTGFLQEQIKQTSNSHETAKLDPLEERILYETEDSGWDTSFSKLAAMGADEVVSTSAPTEYLSAFPSMQSGSWSALMQSAVAEASSSETGIQEELSGLSFQNTEFSTDNQPSNFVSSDQQHVTLSTDSKLHSSSYNMSAPPSSCDSIMSSALPIFHQTGLKLASEQGVNKMASDKSIKHQPKYLSPLSESQLRLKQSDPVGKLGNSWLSQNDQHLKGNARMQSISLNQSHRPIDVFQGSVSSSFLLSGMNKNNFEDIQQETAADPYMAITDVTVDQKDNESIGYSGRQLSSSPAVIGASNKTAAETYESQNCYRGENSSDSYNSKLSQACTPQPDHACLNAEDSVSSARSSHKSPNQALYISSPGASNHQECFSSLKSANALCTNTNYITKGNPNISANSLLKGSPASDVSASLDSQYISELNKANPPRNYGSTTRFGAVVSQSEFQELIAPNVSISEGMANPDKFSFQSSVAENLRQFSLGNGQKGQTWWMPASFGHSVPPSSGPSGPSLAQNYSGKSSILRNSFENSVFNSERSSHEAVFSGPQYVKSQLEGQDMSTEPVASENIQKRYPEMGQDMSMPGSPHDTYPLKNVSSSGFQYSTGASPVKHSFISSTYQERINPLDVWMGLSGQRYKLGDQSKVSSNSFTPSGLHGIDQSSLVGLLSRNKQSIVGGDQKLANESCHEQKPPSIEASGVHESVCRPPLLSGDASYFAGSKDQQGCSETVLTNRSSAGISSGFLQSSGQIQHANNYIVENIKHELHSSVSTNNADSDMAKNFSSSAAGVLGQKQPHEVHNHASYPGVGQSCVARQLSLCHSGDLNIVASSSRTSSRPLEIVTSLSALQYIQASKVPIFGSKSLQDHSSGNNMASDRIRNVGIRPQMAPAWYKQYDYIKNGQMLSLSDSAVLSSVKPYQTVQLTDTGTHVNEYDGSKDHGSVLGAHNQIVNEQLLMSSVLPVDSVNIKLPPSKPKKRKAAMHDCLPWHKEVMQTCKELPEISFADEEWAEASNRLIEKGVDWGEQSEGIQPAARAKRRLILTTQLIQQVFQPPPFTILSVDAATEYETMAYFIAKLTLADACFLANKAKTCHNLPENGNIDAARLRNIWSNAHPSLVKDVEELVHKAKRLESYVNGLDRSVSVVDVRVECQELEKFCLINHFAKYHSRVVQFTGTDSASSSTVSSVRPFLQRYVSAVPLPQKLPDGSQCLSL